MRVLVDVQWRNGDLEAYRQDGDGTWRGFVRWSEGLAATNIRWSCEKELQPFADVERDRYA